MKIYMGTPNPGGGAHLVSVVKDGDAHALDMRLDLASHSPTGFEWGYAGSGPAQLALALCVDALGDDKQALRIHQEFKMAAVARWPSGKPRAITHAEVLKIIRTCQMPEVVAAKQAMSEANMRVGALDISAAAPMPWRLDASGFLVDAEGRSIAGALIRAPAVREFVLAAVMSHAKAMGALRLALPALQVAASLARDLRGADHADTRSMQAAFELAKRFYVEAGGDLRGIEP